MPNNDMLQPYTVEPGSELTQKYLHTKSHYWDFSNEAINTKFAQHFLSS